MGTSVSQYHEHQPTPRVAAWVQRAVGYRVSGFPGGVHVGMPSCSVTLVIPLDEPLTLSADRSGASERFDSVLAGLATSPAHIHHDGSQHGMHLALRPGAVRALFGVRAAELAESSVELRDVMGAAADRLRDRLHEIDSWDGRFGVVEDALRRRSEATCHGPPVAGEVAEAWRLIGASAGVVSIREVAGAVGWSMRQLQHRFRAEFGVTPKAVARVRRFERSVPLVSAARLPLTDVALRCGWADHAHMDRDWRSLAGIAPSRWRTDDVLAGG